MADQKHSEREHALLSASGAERWLTCTPSARLEDEFPDKDTSYSLEGTRAHELAEQVLSTMFGATSDLGWAEFEEAVKAEPELREVGAYIEHVYSLYQSKQADGLNPAIFLEARLDYSRWAPEGFGTGDVVMVYGETVEIIDLKYGKGVPVNAYENPQLKLYGLGAYELVKDIYDIDVVKMTIVQPRLESTTTHETFVESLLQWAEDEVKPRARLAFDGEGVYVIGDHCQFCRAAAVCSARADHNLEVAKHDFKSADTLTNAEISVVLPQLDDLVKWAKAVQDYALDELLAGREVPGYKAVEGRSVRKIVDEDGLAAALIADGTPEAMLYERKLYGITALEKLVGKKQFSELSKGFVEKPEGKPTLAKDSDKRPALNSALNDFSEV